MTPNDERAQIRAEAIRECIDALPFPGSNVLYRGALEALLPKPDPAKELVEEYERFVCGPKEELLDGVKTRLMHFTTRLIDTGRLTP